MSPLRRRRSACKPAVPADIRLIQSLVFTPPAHLSLLSPPLALNISLSPRAERLSQRETQLATAEQELSDVRRQLADAKPQLSQYKQWVAGERRRQSRGLSVKPMLGAPLADVMLVLRLVRPCCRACCSQHCCFLGVVPSFVLHAALLDGTGRLTSSRRAAAAAEADARRQEERLASLRRSIQDDAARHGCASRPAM
jgi:hypothetical protein